MEREAIARPVLSRKREAEHRSVHRWSYRGKIVYDFIILIYTIIVRNVFVSFE